MKVSLILPTYNEVEGMKAIMPEIDKSWYDELIIVDGGSTDGTIEYAQEKGYPIFVQKKKGLRQGLMEACEKATGDIIIEFSPDGNSIAEKIPPLIEKMKEGYDMVIVSRYADGAKSYDDDVITSFGNWMFTNLINLVHGAHYTDAMVMFRAFKKDIIKTLDLDNDVHYSYVERLFFTKISWEPLLSVRCAKKKLKYTEIPGDEPPRIGGERKLQIVRWGSAYLTQVLREKVYWQ